MWNESLLNYDVLILPRSRYREPPPLPDGFSFDSAPPRSVERDLLAAEFDHWKIPSKRRFPGGRSDSAMAIRHDDQVVAVVYLGAENELGLSGYGQVHYAVIAPGFRGRRLYGPLFHRLLVLANDWDLGGVVLISDREGLVELYESWGALPVGVLRRSGRFRRLIRRADDSRQRLRVEAERKLSLSAENG